MVFPTIIRSPIHLCIMFLAIPVISAPIETVFIIPCKLLSSDRCHLLPNNFENFALLKVNQDLALLLQNVY